MIRTTHFVVLYVVAGAPRLGRADGVLAAPAMLPSATALATVTLESRSDGETASLAPDLWYGVGPRLTLGVATSHRSDGSIGADRGLCIAGCLAADARFRGPRIAAHVPLVYGPTRVTGEVATEISAWRPAHAAMLLGAIVDWSGPTTYARVRPRLAVGLLGRADGNRDRASASFTVGATVVRPIAIEIGTGAEGSADSEFFAGMRAPAWAQLVLRTGAGWSAGLAFGADDLLAGRNRHGFAALTVEVSVAT